MSSWLSLSIEDVRELGARMRQHDSAADALLTQAQTVYRQVDSMREYCSEMNQLNEVASGRPRSALIHSIRQEDRYIMQLSQENRELRQALEEQRNVMELIMSKYREQVAKLLSGGGREGARGGQLALQRKLAANVERIREMVCVMREAAQLSERDSHAATATLARLHAENRNLREMMQIASAYGSVKPPGRADAATQTGGEGGACQAGPEEGASDDPFVAACEDEEEEEPSRDTIKLNPLFGLRHTPPQEPQTHDTAASAQGTSDAADSTDTTTAATATTDTTTAASDTSSDACTSASDTDSVCSADTVVDGQS